MVYQLSEDEIWFPQTELADEDGLLAVGGDLSANRLLLAYQHGIFPWYSDDTPILWYSSTMRKLIKSNKFQITFDKCFADVIRACANIRRDGEPGTWITSAMQEAYINLHRLDHAHSVEVWENDVLVGGLYGVAINRVFCGESMFSKVNNASKTALIWLCQNKAYTMIDCQVYTSHLESLGAEFISRDDYMKHLKTG